MKKLLFTLACLLISSLSAMAQAIQMATLSHVGSETTYYGLDALRDAYKAAEDGDVITLSQGIFHAVNIAKSITIRGAGGVEEPEKHLIPSVIRGKFEISAPAGEEKRISFEGIYHFDQIKFTSDIAELNFLKCRLEDLFGSTGKTDNECLINIEKCKILLSLYLPNNCQANCVNSFIDNPNSYYKETGKFNINNCVINLSAMTMSEKENHFPLLYNSTLKNSIISIYHFDESSIDESNTIENCLAVGAEVSQVFDKVHNVSNKIEAGYGMFQTYDGFSDDSSDFHLTPEAATKYLGSDGTQIGIYGGSNPFGSNPTNQ